MDRGHVDYCDVFINGLDSYPDGTIHCRGPTFFDEETKYTYMDWEGIIFYQIVIFGVNYSFNAHS